MKQTSPKTTDDARQFPVELAEPDLVRQPHGGALLSGGVPGHRGGAGRPPSVIRERCRGSFAERLTVLEEIADDSEVPIRDRLKAIDLLGKYGLGTQRELSGLDGDAIPFGVIKLPVQGERILDE